MENEEKIEYLQPTYTERKVINSTNIGTALVLGLIMVFVYITTLLITSISILLGVALLAIFAMLYFIALIFILEPMKIREINNTILRTVQKPILKEVFIDRPVVQEVVVEKPVYRDVVRNVYLSSKSPLKIPKYDYLGSLQTKRYHIKNCRLGKLIKRKYKVSNNNKSFFKKKKFKACKVCIRKKR